MLLWASFPVGTGRKAKGTFCGIKVKELGCFGGRDYYFREFRWRADIEVKLRKEAELESRSASLCDTHLMSSIRIVWDHVGTPERATLSWRIGILHQLS